MARTKLRRLRAILEQVHSSTSQNKKNRSEDLSIKPQKMLQTLLDLTVWKFRSQSHGACCKVSFIGGTCYLAVSHIPFAKFPGLNLFSGQREYSEVALIPANSVEGRFDLRLFALQHL